MKNTQGIALLIVLLFLQIFSLLGLHALLNTTLFVKRVNYEWQYEQALQNAQTILKQLESHPKQKSHCFIAIHSRGALMLKPLSWWQENTCSESRNEFRYYYAFELLGRDATQNKCYRITLLARLSSPSGARILLQSLYVDKELRKI